jgi:YidC/Oxa1 family membrane protein insertase
MQMATKQMVYFFPIITVLFARSMPAALSIYWIVTTVFGIAQQLYVNKHIKKEDLAKEEAKTIETSKVDDKIEPQPVAKKDYMTRLMDKRLSKQEKKSGVEITIRKK